MSSPFIMYVLDSMNHIDGIEHKSMFGGYGIYKDGNIFSIIADDQIFFKVDESNKQDFLDYESKPFIYEKGDHKKTTMSYYELPLDILEDPDQLSIWIDKAVEVSKKSKE